MEKCIAFGADGATVNTGVHGGVIALLKRDVGEHVIPIHCMPHQLCLLNPFYNMKTTKNLKGILQY